MTMRPLQISALALSLSLAIVGLSLAQVALPVEGRVVSSAEGIALGTVTKVIFNAEGKPAQVLIQPKGNRASGPRSLPAKALQVAGDGYMIPLSKAEFDSMPAVELAAQ